MKKKLLAVLLVLCLTLPMLPARTFAAGTESGEPKVSTFTAECGGVTYNLLQEGISINLPAGETPRVTFTVTFVNPSRLDKVYIVSSKHGLKDHLEATGSGGTYTADTIDSDFLAGSISVSFSKTPASVSAKEAADTMKNLYDVSGNMIQILPGDVEEDSATHFLLKAASDAAGVYVDAFIDEFDYLSVPQDALDAWLGAASDLSALSSHVLEGEGGTYHLYLGKMSDPTKTDEWLVLVKDITNHKYTKLIIKQLEDNPSLDQVVNYISGVGFASKLVVESNSIHEDMETLRDEIRNSTMSESQKTEALRRTNDLEWDKNIVLLGTTLLPVLTGAATAGPAGLVFYALLAAISATSEYFWNYRVGLIRGSEEVAPFQNEHPGRVPLGAPKPLVNGHFSGYYSITDTLQGSEDYPEGYYYVADTAPGSSWSIPESRSVTLCIHGFLCSFSVQSDATLELEDCKYIENMDGTLAEGYGTTSVALFTGSKLIVDDAYVSRGIGGHYTCTSADIIINSGTVSSIKDDTNNFNITVNGGSLGWISTSTNKETFGTITINDGTIGGGGSAILGGADSDSIGLDKKDIVINGGVLNGSVCSSGGNLTINGGVFNGRVIKKTATGTVEINGGTFNDRVSNTYNAPLRISSGTFLKDIYAHNYISLSEPVTTLAINSRSDITVTEGIKIHSMNNDQAVAVVADGNYTGGVTYYSSATGKGTHMTLQEAQARIRQKPDAYFRLTGDGIAPSGCSHTYQRTEIKPTCTEGGCFLYTCSKCGDTYRTAETASKLGHDYSGSSWKITQLPSENNGKYGVRQRTCQRCGYKDNEAYTGNSGSGTRVSYPVISQVNRNGLSLSDFKAAGKFLAPVMEVENIGSLAKTVKAYISLYNDNGRMLGAQMVNLTEIDHGSQTYTMDPISFGSVSAAAAASLKLFLLSGEEVPLCQVQMDGGGK